MWTVPAPSSASVDQAIVPLAAPIRSNKVTLCHCFKTSSVVIIHLISSWLKFSLQGDCLDVNECLLNNGHGPCQDTCTNRLKTTIFLNLEIFINVTYSTYNIQLNPTALPAKAATSALVKISQGRPLELIITLVKRWSSSPSSSSSSSSSRGLSSSSFILFWWSEWKKY